MSKKTCATCVYCEHHEWIYTEEKGFFENFSSGFCHKRKIAKGVNEQICRYFQLKKGLHTQKWYPGKK